MAIYSPYISPGKCLVLELLRQQESLFLSPFRLRQSALPLLINEFSLGPVPEVNEERIYAGEVNWVFECIWPPVSARMSHGSDTFWLKERNHISCSSKIQSMNNAR